MYNKWSLISMLLIVCAQLLIVKTAGKILRISIFPWPMYLYPGSAAGLTYMLMYYKTTCFATSSFHFQDIATSQRRILQSHEPSTVSTDEVKFLAKASSKNIENKRTLFEFIVATVALKNFTGLSQAKLKITNIEINRFWLTFGHVQMNDNIL